jgi:hypothetical protein
MASSSDTPLLLWLFALPAVVLLWAVVRTHHRIARGKESAQLRKLNKAEIAAGVAALVAAFSFLH